MTTPHKNPAAVELGRSGGKAGRGASKRRSPEHYKRLADAKRRFARETKALTPDVTADKMPT